VNIGGSGGPLAESRREQMRKVQSFLVRLYFSDELQRRCSAAPEALRQELGIEPALWQGVPDVRSEAFRAECRGRRILVAREVGIRYARTLECLIDDLPSSEPQRFARVAESEVFRAFLASEYFSSRRHSLPHPAGLGLGYEIVGKFFFWVDAEFGLSEPGAPELLRTCAHVELGRLLVAASRTTREPYYEPLRQGVCFSQRLGEPGGVTLVITADLEVQVLETRARVAATCPGLPELEELVCRTKQAAPLHEARCS
jgi:hypothetical protein